MMRKIQLVIFVTALIPAIAMAFPIDIEMNSKGLDIDYRTSQIEMTVALQLTNHDMQAAECAVQFRNGPELARTRRVTVGAQKSTTVQYTARRTVLRMRVTINCTEVEDKEKEAD